MQQLKPGIYFEDTFLGVTLGALVNPNGTIMIDAPLRPEDARAWRSALLNQRGGTGRLLISLDSHLDRTLGTRAMETTIVAHQKTAQAFHNRPAIFKGQTIDSGAEWEIYDDAIGTRWASPDITFTDRMSLHWGGAEIILEHHPGPAPGAIWVIIPDEQVVFVGDAVTPNQPPFLAYADLDQWIETIDLLVRSYKNYQIVSGRNGLVSVNEIREQRRYLKKVLRGLERLINRDASSDAIDRLIQSLLSDFRISPIQREQFTQRLRSGLSQYYTRHFQPKLPLDPSNLDSSEA